MRSISGQGDFSVVVGPWDWLPVGELAHETRRACGNTRSGRLERVAEGLGFLLEDIDGRVAVDWWRLASPEASDIEDPSRHIVRVDGILDYMG